MIAKPKRKGPENKSIWSRHINFFRTKRKICPHCSSSLLFIRADRCPKCKQPLSNDELENVRLGLESWYHVGKQITFYGGLFWIMTFPGTSFEHIVPGSGVWLFVVSSVAFALGIGLIIGSLWMLRRLDHRPRRFLQLPKKTQRRLSAIALATAGIIALWMFLELFLFI